MKGLKIHTFKGEKVRDDREIINSNSLVYSELNSFEIELYSGHYGIKMPLNGCETYVLNNKVFEVQPFNYLLTNPGEKTEVSVFSDAPVKGLCIGITESFIQEILKGIQQDESDLLDQKTGDYEWFSVINHRYPFVQNSELSKFLEGIKYTWNKWGQFDHFEEEQFYYSLTELIIKNQLDIRSKVNNLNQIKVSTKEEIYRRVDVMNQYIYDNFIEDISLEMLSKVSCLSKYHAIRSYQKIIGVSPYQKIMDLRIQKAKELLSIGMSVKSAAHQCGFSEYRGFSKLFKRKTGTSPSEFKKNSSN